MPLIRQSLLPASLQGVLKTTHRPSSAPAYGPFGIGLLDVGVGAVFVGPTE
jgi:hypothetical protein